MTADPVGIAKYALNNQYRDFRENAVFGGSGALWKLSRFAWDAFRAETDSAKLIALVLAIVFDNVARKIDEAPVQAIEGERWFVVLDPAITNCLDLLVSRQGGPVEPSLVRLANAYGSVLAEISN